MPRFLFNSSEICWPGAQLSTEKVSQMSVLGETEIRPLSPFSIGHAVNFFLAGANNGEKPKPKTSHEAIVGTWLQFLIV